MINTRVSASSRLAFATACAVASCAAFLVGCQRGGPNNSPVPASDSREPPISTAATHAAASVDLGPIRAQGESAPSPPSETTVFVSMDGWANLVATDGHPLGVVSSSPSDAESICNPYGEYGSISSPTSIRNPSGQYGSPGSAYSPYNPGTLSPPAIVLNESVIGYLTKNGNLAGAIDPDVLFASYFCVPAGPGE